MQDGWDLSHLTLTRVAAVSKRSNYAFKYTSIHAYESYLTSSALDTSLKVFCAFAHGFQPFARLRHRS